MIFLVISLLFGIAWYITLPQNKGALKNFMVDQNKNNMADENNTTHDLVFWMDIYNSGSPTIVRAWNLVIKDLSTNSVQGYIQRDFPEKVAWENGTITYNKNDYLFEKTRESAIPTGSMRHGFLFFRVFNCQRKWLEAAGTSYEVTFQDIYGNGYTNVFKWPLPLPQ